jgi:ankyrin repeat protein
MMKNYNRLLPSLILTILLISCSAGKQKVNASHWHCLVSDNDINFKEAVFDKQLDLNLDSTDEDGFNLLHISATSGNFDSLIYIFENNIIPYDVLNDQNNVFQVTPLMTAVTSGCYRCVEYLINKNADLYRVDAFGKQAVDIAQDLKYPEIYELLKNHLEQNSRTHITEFSDE